MHFKLNRNLFFLKLFVLGATCSAQDGSPFSVNYGHSPLENDGAVVSHWDATVLLPIAHGVNSNMAGGFQYSVLVLDDFPLDIGHKLHTLGIPLGARIKLNDRDKLFLATKILVGSDLEDISGEDFIFSVGAGVVRKMSEKFSIGLGLGYSRQFFGNQLLPFMDFDARLSDKLHLKGRFPLQGNIAYDTGTKSAVGWEWGLGAKSFRLSESDYDSGYVRYSHVNGLLFYRYKIFGGFHVKVSGGFMGQRYQWYNDGDSGGWTIVTIPLSDEQDPIEELESSGLILQIGLFFSF